MSVTCTPQSLIDASRCFDKCIPRGKQKEPAIYLLCQWVQVVKKNNPDWACGEPSNTIQISGAGDSTDNGVYLWVEASNAWESQSDPSVPIIVLSGEFWYLISTGDGPEGADYFCPSNKFPCGTWGVVTGQAPPPTGQYIQASAVPVPPPIGQFTFAPATAVISWTELGVPHTGNLAAFNATAVLANVDSITANGLGLTSISGLSSLTNLSALYISTNSLTTLNVSGLSVLDTLDCKSNLITTITGLGDCHIISVINCSTNLMDPAHVSSVLCDVDASGANVGALDISNNSAPTAAGLICSASLDPAKGWTVTHD